MFTCTICHTVTATNHSCYFCYTLITTSDSAFTYTCYLLVVLNGTRQKLIVYIKSLSFWCTFNTTNHRPGVSITRSFLLPNSIPKFLSQTHAQTFLGSFASCVMAEERLRYFLPPYTPMHDRTEVLGSAAEELDVLLGLVGSGSRTLRDLRTPDDRSAICETSFKCVVVTSRV